MGDIAVKLEILDEIFQGHNLSTTLDFATLLFLQMNRFLYTLIRCWQDADMSVKVFSCPTVAE